jgi:hypothetical protein
LSSMASASEPPNKEIKPGAFLMSEVVWLICPFESVV